MANPIVHFEIIGKDANVTTLAMFADPDGNVIGLTTGTSSS